MSKSKRQPKTSPNQTNLPFKPRFINKVVPTLTPKLLDSLLTEAKSGEFVEDFNVGPDVAEVLLAQHNPINRNINRVAVNSLVRDMTEGRWLGHVGDEMTIDFNGNVNNGQHRLKGIILSGTTQRFTMRFGIDPEKRLVEGRGRAKQYADSLSMLDPGTKHRTARASLIRLLFSFLRDPSRPNTYAGNYKPTNSELHTIHEKFGPELYESLKFVMANNINLVTVETNAALVHFLLKQTDKGHLADEFMEGLATGANLTKDDPRMVIRNRFLADANTKKAFRSKNMKDASMGLIAKGWNAWTAGKSWSSKEHTPDVFIRIDGLNQVADQTIY